METFEKFFGPKCPLGIVGVADTYKVLPVPEEKMPEGCLLRSLDIEHSVKTQEDGHLPAKEGHLEQILLYSPQKEINLLTLQSQMSRLIEL